MIGNHTRRTGAALRTLQMAAFPCPAKPSRRSADSPLASSHRSGGTRLLRCISTLPAAPTKRSRSLNDQFQVCSQEASTMAMICKRPQTVAGCPIRVLRRPGGQS